jgi:hypothetical protein
MQRELARSDGTTTAHLLGNCAIAVLVLSCRSKHALVC